MKCSSTSLAKAVEVNITNHPCFIGAMQKIEEVSALLLALKQASDDIDISMESGLSGILHLAAMVYEDLDIVKRHEEMKPE